MFVCFFFPNVNVREKKKFNIVFFVVFFRIQTYARHLVWRGDVYGRAIQLGGGGRGSRDRHVEQQSITGNEPNWKLVLQEDASKGNNSDLI